MDGEISTRTIRCTEENARDFQRLVKADPELSALVRDLQRDGLFPGLRSMSITLTGDESTLVKGLGAWPTKNASKASGDQK